MLSVDNAEVGEAPTRNLPKNRNRTSRTSTLPKASKKSSKPKSVHQQPPQGPRDSRLSPQPTSRIQAASKLSANTNPSHTSSWIGEKRRKSTKIPLKNPSKNPMSNPKIQSQRYRNSPQPAVHARLELTLPAARKYQASNSHTFSSNLSFFLSFFRSHVARRRGRDWDIS